MRIKNIFSQSLIVLIKSYQLLISPHLGQNCRFHPSCSNYAIEALQTHGFFKGFWLAFRRVAKCNPWGSSGYDPVPPRKDF